jgi:MoaA/NifB/PqqE/SkfB family radical SAM enzyme
MICIICQPKYHMKLQCKLAELTLNCDMSGRVTPCNYNNLYLKDDLNRVISLDKGNLQQAWHSQSRHKFLATFDKGIRNPYCKDCWNDEKAGNESVRQRFNRQLADVQSLPDQPRILIIKHGNKCNLACRSCNPHSSSQWYKDAYALEEPVEPFKIWLEKFSNHETSYVNNKDLEQTLSSWNQGIIFYDLYGGEPLLHPLTYQIIDSALDSQDIQIHTNGTIYKPDLVEKLARFRSANIGFSIDGICGLNDYIRSGSKWATILDNLQRYMADVEKFTNISLAIRHCTMSHNVYYIPETFDFFADMGYCLQFTNRVTDKADANICYLPAHVKEAIHIKLSSHKPRHYEKNWIQQRDCTLNFLANEPVDWHKKSDSFLSMVTRLDRLRGQNYADVMPEFAALFGAPGRT